MGEDRPQEDDRERLRQAVADVYVYGGRTGRVPLGERARIFRLVRKKPAKWSDEDAAYAQGVLEAHSEAARAYKETGGQKKDPRVTAPPAEVVVKTYRGRQFDLAKKMAKDIEKMTAAGYSVEGQVTVPGHRGLLLGAPKDQVMVTYRRRE